MLRADGKAVNDVLELATGLQGGEIHVVAHRPLTADRASGPGSPAQG
jgi:hypothetical protein